MFSWIFGKQSINGVNEELVKKIILEIEEKRIEREIALKEALMDRERAYHLAKDRESFFWYFATGSIISIFSIFSCRYHKNLAHLLPLGPIMGYLSYEAHNAFGNKIEIITKNASQLLLEDEASGVTLNPITVEEIKLRIDQNKKNNID